MEICTHNRYIILLKFLFNILWFLIHIFYGTNDSLKGKICGTGETVAGGKGLFFFLVCESCGGSALVSKALTRVIGCEGGSVSEALAMQTGGPEISPPKPVRCPVLVTPQLEAEAQEC